MVGIIIQSIVRIDELLNALEKEVTGTAKLDFNK